MKLYQNKIIKNRIYISWWIKNLIEFWTLKPAEQIMKNHDIPCLRLKILRDLIFLISPKFERKVKKKKVKLIKLLNYHCVLINHLKIKKKKTFCSLSFAFLEHFPSPSYLFSLLLNTNLWFVWFSNVNLRFSYQFFYFSEKSTKKSTDI